MKTTVALLFLLGCTAAVLGDTENARPDAVVNCWYTLKDIDHFTVWETEAVRTDGIHADPTWSTQHLLKMSNALDAETGQIDAAAVKVLMNYTHLTPEAKIRAADMIESCVARVDKTMSMTGWLAFQAIACMNRAILMATDMKGCPRQSAAPEGQSESPSSHSLIGCWQTPRVDPYTACEVEAIKTGGLYADPTLAFQCLLKMSNTLNSTTGQINAAAMRAVLAYRTKLTPEQKTRAADLAEQCVSHPDKVITLKGWTAVQANTCLNRAFAMVTGMKGCPPHEPFDRL